MSRVWREFGEMPGLRLTPSQGSRLWSLQRDVCERVFAGLERQGLLAQDASGTFFRRDIGEDQTARIRRAEM